MPRRTELTSALIRRLFEGSSEGAPCDDESAFGVQYRPEPSLGPSDAGHLFGRFVGMMERAG